uniref:Uncharacterized protein n=1 Tax=Pelusios castaneus TaxID=367368 RepID=A0A8C8VFV9_9SAUR
MAHVMPQPSGQRVLPTFYFSRNVMTECGKPKHHWNQLPLFQNGAICLHAAAKRGHASVVKALLQRGADVDAQTKENYTALHIANGHDQIADMLLWHKAFVNVKTKLGVTPLHLGAQNGYNHLVKLLVETHRASIDAMTLVRTEQTRSPVALLKTNEFISDLLLQPDLILWHIFPCI